MRAKFGHVSLKKTPGNAVGIADNVPRICSGASGLGSSESMCVTPPPIHRKMTDFAFAVGLGVNSPRAVPPSNPGSTDADNASGPTLSRSRRQASDFNCSFFIAVSGLIGIDPRGGKRQRSKWQRERAALCVVGQGTGKTSVGLDRGVWLGFKVAAPTGLQV